MCAKPQKQRVDALSNQLHLIVEYAAEVLLVWKHICDTRPKVRFRLLLAGNARGICASLLDVASWPLQSPQCSSRASGIAELSLAAADASAEHTLHHR